MVYSEGGVAAENASVIIDKGSFEDEGSALIAMGTGTGSLVYITDMIETSVPALNNYGLEVRTGESADASIFASNSYEDGTALEAHGNVKIIGDGITNDATAPMLLIADDSVNYQPAFDGSLVHIFSSTPTTAGSALLIHTDSEVKGQGIYVETVAPEATGMMIYSQGGVVADNASLIVDKGDGVDEAGLGSAIIARGGGLGAVVNIEATDDAGTALKINKGKVVLANGEATRETMNTMGAYSVVSLTSATDNLLNLSDLPTGENGQVMYIINNTGDTLAFNGLQVLNGDMVMVISYGSVWHTLNITAP